MSRILAMAAMSIGLSLLGCAGGGSSTAYKSFGAAPSVEKLTTVDAKMLLTRPDAYNGKNLRITGTVSEVCTAKGCWLSLGGPQDEGLFVKFICPIEGRLIPAEAVGKPAIVEGTVTVVSMSEEQARHYAKDGGATEAEIAKIVGPQKRVTVASPSARIAELK